MVRAYVPDTDLPPAWVVDIDGTLALREDRGPYDWSRVGEDRLNTPVADLVHGLNLMHIRAVLVSGRSAVCETETRNWLGRMQIPIWGLYMRPAGNYQADVQLKREIFWTYVAPKWRVLGVIDDRQSVVDMWRSMGLTCAQVAPGDF